MSRPLPNIEAIEVQGGDKLLHAIEYGILSFFLYKAMGTTFKGVPAVRLILLVLFVAGVYSVSDELHQSFVPGRDACVADALADHVGILIGMGVSLL